MDEFDKKREMIQALMGMLKKSAGDEMSSHDQVTLTPKPSMPVADKPHMKEEYAKGGMVDLSKPNADLMEPASDDMHMADGGMPLATDEPERELSTPDAPGGNDALEMLPEAPKDEQGNEEMQQKDSNEDMEEQDEDNNQSSFEAFLPRKKKK